MSAIEKGKPNIVEPEMLADYQREIELLKKIIDECEAALHFYANYEPCAGNQYIADKAEQSIRKWRKGKP